MASQPHPYNQQPSRTGPHAYPPHLAPSERAYASSADQWAGASSSEDRSRVGGPADSELGSWFTAPSSTAPLIGGPGQRQQSLTADQRKLGVEGVAGEAGNRNSAPWIDSDGGGSRDASPYTARPLAAVDGSASSSHDDHITKERKFVSDDPNAGGWRSGGRGGKWRWTALHRWQGMFLLAILAQTCAVVTLVGVIFGRVAHQIIDANARLNSIKTYLAVFIVANAFAILVAIDALSYKNTMQLAALVVFNYMMMVYGAVLPGQVKNALEMPDGGPPGPPPDCSESLTCFGVEDLYGNIQGLVIAIPIITGVCACWMAACTRRLYAENGWELFKEIGADITLKRVYQQWQIFSVLNKFNFFFFLGFSIQLLILVSGLSTTEEAITIVAVPVILLVIVLAAIGVRREIHALMVLFAVVWLGALVYYFYKLVRILSHQEHYAAAVRSLALFAFLSIFTLFASGIFAALCWASFGKGLKDQEVHSLLDYCLGRRRKDDTEKKPERMSLD